MSLFDRLGRVARAEWSNRTRARPPSASSSASAVDARVRAPAPAPRPAVVDVQGALRVLELTGTPSLDEIRARYRALARRYHPKTQSSSADEVQAARVVLDALTDALELLEEHLLPLPETP